jgi:hypothetical protein
VVTDTPITSWRTAFAALRRPGLRIEAATVILTAGVLYAACFEAAWITAVLGHELLIRPAIIALFGHEPGPIVVQFASGALIGGPVLAWSISLMRRQLQCRYEHVRRLHEAMTAPKGTTDAHDLLDLYAMADRPKYLVDVMMVLNPHPEVPSWLHARRRIRLMFAWVRRNAEIMACASGLERAGLLRCTERGRRDGLNMYEVTDAGRESVMEFAGEIMEG